AEHRQNRQRDQHGAAGREHIERLPSELWQIGVDTARHSHQAENVHREKGSIESDEEKPERQRTEFLAVHTPAPLREPVVKSAEEREERAADQHVMQMRHDEVRVMKLPVERHRRDEESRQSTDDEDDEEAEDVENGSAN